MFKTKRNVKKHFQDKKKREFLIINVKDINKPISLIQRIEEKNIHGEFDPGSG